MSNELFLKINIQVIKSGAYAKLPTTVFQTLVTLASYQDENGECFPSQKEIAEKAGLSERTVRDHIKILLDFRIDGQPILVRTKEKVKRKNFYYSKYKFTKYSGMYFGKGSLQNFAEGTADIRQDDRKNPAVTTGENLPDKKNHITRTIEEEPNKKNNTIKNSIVVNELSSKDLINYFRQLYLDKYGIEYRMLGKDWGMFGKLLNTKVIDKFDNELILKATDTLFEIYDDEFKNPKYPRPTLWNYTNWVFDKCITKAQEQDKKTEGFEEQQKEAEEYADNFGSDEDILNALNSL